MSIQENINNVREWGIEKGITGPNGQATLQTQFAKTLEEVAELSDAIDTSDHDGITDGIGDTAVTLIMLSEIHGISFEDCLSWAYHEIKSRTGRMIDGAFVKDTEGK